MAVRTASPWWLSAILGLGLVLLFLGERAFEHLDTARLVLTGFGGILVLGTTAVRALAMARSPGERGRVERIFLYCHLGVLAALGGYVLTTGWGNALVGIDGADAEAHARFQVPTTVLWLVVLFASLLPILMAEISLGTARRWHLHLGGDGGADDGAVESFRVREMVASGLTLAFAAAFLMVTCNVAGQRNVRKDYSYFKTSSPGSATLAIAGSISEPVRVLLFFPDVSEVKEEVRGYFEALEAETGTITIEEHDRLAARKLAQEHGVNQDGYVVLVRGESSEKLRIDPDPKKARRNDLRTLDARVQTELMKLVRKQGTAYLTIGHGELNDPKSLGAMASQYPDAAAARFKRVLEDQHYKIHALGLQQGLGSAVPDDADLVVVLSPKRAFLDQEIESLRRYVDAGGALLLTMDPVGEATLGALAGSLGVEFEAAPLSDDQHFLRRSMTPSDRRFIKTNQFSSHASVTTLSRRRADEALVFVNAGSLADAPYTGEGAAPKKTYVVRSMSSSFADLDDDLSFDADTETRQSYNLAVAIEGSAAPGGERGMRAFVVSDAEIFSDAIMTRLFLPEHFAADAIKWLGGEEKYAGETVSEKDVYIEHTNSEDVAWFYSTIVGAPVLVMLLGLGIVALRRRRNQRRSA